MERRNFIKNSCAVCAAFLIPDLMIVGLSGCKTTSVYSTALVNKTISVPVSLFTESELQIIRVKELEDDIALRKEQDGTYTALLMRCTHADNPLVSTGNGFICNLHGSTFDKEGAVTKGPAALPLRKYSVEIVSDNILIHIN